MDPLGLRAFCRVLKGFRVSFKEFLRVLYGFRASGARFRVYVWDMLGRCISIAFNVFGG